MSGCNFLITLSLVELALKKTYIVTPEPTLIIACGDNAIDGGIYKRSYAITNRVANVIPVDCYIPGCPPAPINISVAIHQLIDKAVQKKTAAFR
jgi:Ni,Fe-hydrogenase III small subunit